MIRILQRAFVRSPQPLAIIPPRLPHRNAAQRQKEEQSPNAVFAEPLDSPQPLRPPRRGDAESSSVRCGHENAPAEHVAQSQKELPFARLFLLLQFTQRAKQRREGPAVQRGVGDSRGNGVDGGGAGGSEGGGEGVPERDKEVKETGEEHATGGGTQRGARDSGAHGEGEEESAGERVGERGGEEREGGGAGGEPGAVVGEEGEEVEERVCGEGGEDEGD